MLQIDKEKGHARTNFDNKKVQITPVNLAFKASEL